MKEYRADIDGLRAIAVLSVVLFHLNADWVPNGFLGVDIFFVLSGFLITSILYRDILADKFSFKDFYIRRIKRILPVFFVVLFFTLGLSHYLFLPDNDQGVIKSALASALFAANILFSQQGGYFDISSESKPLLHVWSLSVEEQFYFVFPILLIGLIYWTKKKENSTKGVITPLFVLLLLSLFSSFLPLSRWGLDLDTYYLPHTRFGEMLVGSLLAIFMAGYKKNATHPPLINIYTSIIGGLSFLCLIICLFWEGVFVAPYFPGPLALVPCIATAALLYCNRQTYWLSSILSSKLVVWIGKISYSLYLWHWVVLAFIRYFLGEGTLPNEIVFIASTIMLLLSAISYYLVEQPIRQMKLSFLKALCFLYLLPTLLVACWYKVPKNYYPINPMLIDNLVSDDCSDNIEKDCVLGDVSKEPTVLVAGDSNTKQLSAFIDQVGLVEGWSAKLYGATACPFFLGYDYRFQRSEGDLCRRRNEFLAKEYKKYDTIILGVYWGSSFYKEDPKFIPHLEKTLKTLLSEGKQIILINSVYKVKSTRLQESYAFAKGALSPWNRSNYDFRGELFEECKRNATEIKDLVAKKYPQVRWVDLIPYHPKDLLYQGLPIMRDNEHLNLYGAKMIAKEFIKRDTLIK